MKVILTAVSPFAFEIARINRRVIIKKKKANKREYRDKIGHARDCFLVFISETKLGMIPLEIVNFDSLDVHKWHVSKVDVNSGIIEITNE